MLSYLRLSKLGGAVAVGCILCISTGVNDVLKNEWLTLNGILLMTVCIPLPYITYIHTYRGKRKGLQKIFKLSRSTAFAGVFRLSIHRLSVRLLFF